MKDGKKDIPFNYTGPERARDISHWLAVHANKVARKKSSEDEIKEAENAVFRLSHLEVEDLLVAVWHATRLRFPPGEMRRRPFNG